MILARLATLAVIPVVLQVGAPFAVAQSTDFEFFKTRVEPIFLKRRPNHARCVVCHTGGGNGFSLVPLSPGSTTWNEEQSQRNYAAVSFLVAPGDPASSPLLMQPLAPEAGGNPFHSGGTSLLSRSYPVAFD